MILDLLAGELDAVPAAALAASYERQSAAYRAGRATDAGASEVDVLAYAAARMPATYAAVSRVLEDLRQGMPDFAPASVLDLGAGPGTAGWAAVETFPETERVTFVEQARAMRELGQRLGRGDNRTQWVDGDVRRPPGSADLVVASYVLGELPEVSRAAAVESWWEAAEGVLVVVEPGTPQGWQAVKLARQAATRHGAYVVAPCPLAPGCARSEEDWCHFATRVQRTKAHRLLKGARLGFEDEKYSYVTLSREPAKAAARVAGTPERHGGHVRIRVCGDDGVTDRVVTKSQGEAYRWARQAGWGDRVS